MFHRDGDWGGRLVFIEVSDGLKGKWDNTFTEQTIIMGKRMKRREERGCMVIGNKIDGLSMWREANNLTYKSIV